MDEKTCSRCGETFPLDAEHWYWDGDKVRGARCKGCTKDGQREHRAQPGKSSAERMRQSRAAKADRLGEDAVRAAKAAEMADYRARKRAPDLVPIVALVAGALAGKSVDYDEIALMLARAGVYISAGKRKD